MYRLYSASLKSLLANYALCGWRIFGEQGNRPNWPYRKVAAAVRANTAELNVNAMLAKGTLEGADHGVRRIGS